MTPAIKAILWFIAGLVASLSIQDAIPKPLSPEKRAELREQRRALERRYESCVLRCYSQCR